MWCSSSFFALTLVLASPSGGAGATASTQVRMSGVGQCWCIQDTDYSGGDLGWMQVGAIAECCSACSTYPACTVSVLVGKRCYLKNSSVRPSASPHHLACRPQPGKSRPDHLESSSKVSLAAASCSIFGCGGSFSPSRGCQCNPGCKAHGDCCYDYAEQCSSSTGKDKGNSNISIHVNLVNATAEAYEPSTASQTDNRHTSHLKPSCQKVAGRFLLNCSGVEKVNNGSHGRNMVLTKFLQTALQLDKGRQAFHSAPRWIVLLVAVAVFTTFLTRANAHLCRTREQADAEAGQFLEPMGNICEQQSGGTHFCSCANRRQESKSFRISEACMHC